MQLKEKKPYKKGIIPNIFLLGIIFLCFPIFVNAQNTGKITVSGTVSDASGEPLIGVSVLEKGTTNGTVTDLDGAYSITVSQNAQLEFSYVGFTRQEVSVDNRTTIDITLQEDVQMIEEIVVIGYGTMDKKELTSSISHISSKDFLNVGAIDPAMMIQGKVAGVSITNQGSGDPNSGASIQVRGVSSRSAGLGPLIVIDGVPGGNLHNVNPNDIESFDILKDGAAAAIYGTRGSNGVILVTTKKGSRDGSLQTNYHGYTSFDVMIRELEPLTGEQFRTYRSVMNGSPDYGHDTDWLGEITRTGLTQNHSLSLSSGNRDSNFRASVDYRKANGIDIRSDRKEYGARLSFNHTLRSGLLTFSGNVAPRVINKNNADWGAFVNALVANPTSPVYEQDGSGRFTDFRNQQADYNPVEKLTLEKSYTEHKLMDWDMTAKMDIPTLYAKGKALDYILTTQITLAQQINDEMGYWFRPSTSNEAINNGYAGEASQEYKKWRQESLEWLVNFKTSKNDHNLGFTGGYSYQYWMYNQLKGENKDFTSDVLTWDNLGDGSYMKEDGRAGMSSSRNDSKLIAFFGRLTYDYMQRYLLTASLRYEGSSKFGANNKWGYFPAISAGWRISEEQFMKDIAWINDLKFRADYGVTGNQNFDSYRSLATMGGFGDVYYNGEYYKGWAAGKNVNPDLRWEKAHNWNIGVDFRLFGRLTGSFNYFNRKQKDLLGDYKVPIPPYLFDNMYANVGTMQNTGFEIELNVDVVKTKDFSYNTGLVGTTMSNKFLNFSNDIFQGQSYYEVGGMPAPGSPGSVQRIIEGEQVGTFYTHAFAGIDEDGNWLVWNADNTEKVPVSEANDSFKRVTGNGLPKFTMSWNNNLMYKNWDLSLYFRGAFGHDLFDVHEFYYGLQSAPSTSNVTTLAYSKNAAITTGMNVLSDYFIKKGDYLKLDVVTLGYTVPIKQNDWISSLRFYGTARNLFTLTKFDGVDPSNYNVNGLLPGIFGNDDAGTRKNYYPSTRQFLFGVQVDF